MAKLNYTEEVYDDEVHLGALSIFQSREFFKHMTYFGAYPVVLDVLQYLTIDQYKQYLKGEAVQLSPFKSYICPNKYPRNRY